MAFRIENRIGVAAPAPVVWSVLSDFARWGEWNPVIPVIEGRLGIGATVAYELHLPKRPPQRVEGVIVDWVPDSQLIWSLKGKGGLLRSTRYFEIEALTETGCILANGEMGDGWGAALVSRADRAQLRRAFVLVNEAAKARAEDLVREGARA